MSERGWGRVWHGHSSPVGTAPPMPSARRGGEEDEEEEDVAAAPPAPRGAASCGRAAARPLRPQRGRGSPGSGRRGSGFPLSLPCRNFPVPPSVGAPLPRPKGWRAGRGSGSVSAAALFLRPRFVRPNGHLVAVSCPRGSFSSLGLVSGFCKILPSPLGAK